MSLDDLCLQILDSVSSLGRPEDFLAKALDPPLPKAITVAMETLKSVGAVDSLDEITPLGRHLSALPVDVHIGKMILFGAIFSCLDPILTIAAATSYRSPFVVPMGKREEADRARKSFATGHSDHLTIWTAYRQWRSQKDRRSESEFFRKFFLSRQTLHALSNIKRELLQLLTYAGFTGKFTADRNSQWESPSHLNLHSANEPLLKAVICAGLYPNVLRVDLPPLYSSQQPTLNNPTDKASLHPSSVTHSHIPKGYRWLVYHAMVRSSKVFVRDVTFVSPCPLLFFGGPIEVQHEKQTITVDEWITFSAPPKTAVIFKELGKEMDRLLIDKIRKPSTDLSSTKLPFLDIVVQLLSQE